MATKSYNLTEDQQYLLAELVKVINSASTNVEKYATSKIKMEDEVIVTITAQKDVRDEE